MRYMQTIFEGGLRRLFSNGLAILVVAVMMCAPVFAFLILSGCASTPPAKIEHEYVNVPTIVATGCIAATGRPDRPASLKSITPQADWDKLAPGAKAEAINAQAGARLDYEDKDRAATSGCK